jgi:hypothetical protein
MFTFKEFLKALRCKSGELNHALDVYKRYKEAWKEENEIAETMKSLGLKADTRIGGAIQIANQYGIEFDIGTTGWDCRAILRRSKWHNPIDRNVSLETLSFFRIPQSYEQIQEFQGISPRIEIAICKCLIIARTAGVI